MPVNQAVILAAFLAISATAIAQDTPATGSPTSTSQSSSTPQPPAPVPAPDPVPSHRSVANYSYVYRVGAFCGLGASASPPATKPTTGCGVGLTALPLPLFLEIGIMGPQANRSYLSGYLSLDYSIPLARPSTRYLPMAILGYSRLFETGHALDYGLALALPRSRKQPDNRKSLRIELRDYWLYPGPIQHNVMLRIGWMAQVSD